MAQAIAKSKAKKKRRLRRRFWIQQLILLSICPTDIVNQNTAARGRLNRDRAGRFVVESDGLGDRCSVRSFDRKCLCLGAICNGQRGTVTALTPAGILEGKRTDTVGAPICV